MRNGNSSSSQQKSISLSELSFAELARMRQEKATSAKQQEAAPEGEVEQPEEVVTEEATQEIAVAIELRDDIDIQANFCKTPNAKWEIAPLQDLKEYCVYDYLYRLSYGWHRNCCRVGYGAIANNTSIPSRSTAIRAIEGLMDKVHVIRIEEETHSKMGSLYRILSPEEILSGIFKTSIVNMNIVNVNIVNVNISKSTISNLNIVDLSTSGAQNEYNQDEYSEENGSASGSMTISKMSIVNLDTNKNNLKPNLKTTEASRDDTVDKILVVVSSSEFFRNLPEVTIRNLCEEYGCDKVVEKIRSLDEQYTGKEMDNPGGLLTDALKKDYSPPKRMVRKQKARVASRKKEKEQKVEEELRKQQEELREQLNAEKKKLGTKKRKELRDRALEAIHSTDGIKEDFISDALIASEENKILKEEMESD